MRRLGLGVSISILAVASASAQAPAPADFFIHAYHAEKLGSLDCNICHVPVKQGSVMLQRPGHTQCLVCHDDDFNKDLKQKVCAMCHSKFPPEGTSDLVQFPRYSKTRTILFEFAHNKHVDAKVRLDPKTGFRSDCTFCHKFDQEGKFAKFPTHQECSACHGKAGFTPQLTASMDEASCRGCHTPEEIENPGFTETPRMIGAHVASGMYVNIKFSHAAHFKAKDQFAIQCTTCHYQVPRSTGLANLSLPMMLDCVECHDTSKKIAADFRMSNCKVCHDDTLAVEGAAPASHSRNLKPDFHNESFRVQHASAASAPNAKCFVCHQNVLPSIEAKAQCIECHQVMRPISHTARWKDDIHGKYAALDRTNCATCHTAVYCSTCHNELPRSHQPLPVFKAGAHAYLAMLDERSCLTCHTFQNTCAACHSNTLPAKPAITIKK